MFIPYEKSIWSLKWTYGLSHEISIVENGSQRLQNFRIDEEDE